MAYAAWRHHGEIGGEIGISLWRKSAIISSGIMAKRESIAGSQQHQRNGVSWRRNGGVAGQLSGIGSVSAGWQLACGLEAAKSV